MSAWRIGRGYLGFGGGRGQRWGMLARHCGNHGGARAKGGGGGGGHGGGGRAAVEGGAGGVGVSVAQLGLGKPN